MLITATNEMNIRARTGHVLHQFPLLATNSGCRSLAHNKFSGSFDSLERIIADGNLKSLYVRVEYASNVNANLRTAVFWHDVELSE